MALTFGIDVVEVARIRRLADDPAGGADGLFTPSEMSRCMGRRRSHARLAACFAVKEALLKAAGIGLNQGLGFSDIEVIIQGSGAAHLRLDGRMRELIGDIDPIKCLVTSSYSDQLACAVVALER